MIATPADTDVTDVTGFRASVATMVRDLSADALGRLATSWPTEGNLADLIVTEAIAAALEQHGARPAPANSVRLSSRCRHDPKQQANAA